MRRLPMRYQLHLLSWVSTVHCRWLKAWAWALILSADRRQGQDLIQCTQRILPIIWRKHHDNYFGYICPPAADYGGNGRGRAVRASADQRLLWRHRTDDWWRKLRAVRR